MSKTISLELSKQLKEAGAKQESELVFDRHTAIQEAHLERRLEAKGNEEFASFDCHELLERLPRLISEVKDCLGRPTTWDYNLELVLEEDEWVAQYRYREYNNEYFTDLAGVDKVPAEALGKLYLWCLQNGHCEKGE